METEPCIQTNLVGDKGGITISGRQFFYPRIREYNSKITRQIKSLNVKEKILNFYDKL